MRREIPRRGNSNDSRDLPGLLTDQNLRFYLELSRKVTEQAPEQERQRRPELNILGPFSHRSTLTCSMIFHEGGGLRLLRGAPHCTPSFVSMAGG